MSVRKGRSSTKKKTRPKGKRKISRNAKLGIGAGIGGIAGATAVYLSKAKDKAKNIININSSDVALDNPQLEEATVEIETQVDDQSFADRYKDYFVEVDLRGILDQMGEDYNESEVDAFANELGELFPTYEDGQEFIDQLVIEYQSQIDDIPQPTPPQQFDTDLRELVQEEIVQPIADYSNDLRNDNTLEEEVKAVVEPVVETISEPIIKISRGGRIYAFSPKKKKPSFSDMLNKHVKQLKSGDITFKKKNKKVIRKSSSYSLKNQQKGEDIRDNLFTLGLTGLSVADGGHSVGSVASTSKDVVSIDQKLKPASERSEKAKNFKSNSRKRK
ncbi:MAG: hypothetical protein HeimC2_40430 [Candidatus Heimdallarchaeota archaeon LC_2]|nr:MAG: hypothetical protein HeimC2_40430 [Candidatus Heimdallarchaeota archaeon LC_2]